jgi:hypothetical protein
MTISTGNLSVEEMPAATLTLSDGETIQLDLISVFVKLKEAR